ncbi:YXWGXW repeat-containing protein [Xylophilus sp. GW821-FHT01B05]
MTAKKNHRIVQAAIAASLAVLSLGAAVLPTAAQAQVYVQVAPPPPRAERMPPPRRGMVWAPGHWEWRGGRHVWVRGVWMQERRGYHYRQPAWVQRGNRWEMQRGGWDRDGDGVPNRYDRRPNDPYRR